MAKLNYNRPNNGYEREPWRKSYDSNQTYKYNELPKTFPEHKGHKIILTKTKPGSVHSGAYRCVTCNKHLAWASKDKVKNVKQNQPYIIKKH